MNVARQIRDEVLNFVLYSRAAVLSNEQLNKSIEIIAPSIGTCRIPLSGKTVFFYDVQTVSFLQLKSKSGLQHPTLNCKSTEVNKTYEPSR